MVAWRLQVVEADGHPDIPGHAQWSVRVDVLCSTAHARAAELSLLARASQHTVA